MFTHPIPLLYPPVKTMRRSHERIGQVEREQSGGAAPASDPGTRDVEVEERPTDHAHHHEGVCAFFPVDIRALSSPLGYFLITIVDAISDMPTYTSS